MTEAVEWVILGWHPRQSLIQRVNLMTEHPAARFSESGPTDDLVEVIGSNPVVLTPGDESQKWLSSHFFR
jgi:hypothetical protein